MNKNIETNEEHKINNLKPTITFQNKKIAVDFRVAGIEEDVAEFVRMLVFMNQCQQLGASRTFQVKTDGDGSTVSILTTDNENILDHTKVRFDIDEPQHFYIGE